MTYADKEVRVHTGQKNKKFAKETRITKKSRFIKIAEQKP